ncbi:hypothetical protein [Paracoccus contaminans]|uniref:hypothetical protein n=1 Tax=Paracoccus contaminans TaxID=1945662 RepID=UPI001469F948|nr:hypothetical protein [Paracoccus contaminans]
MTGQDRRFRGGGFGGDLPVDARRRIAMAAKAIGVAIDMLDCGDPDPVARRKALCKSGGFRSVSSNPFASSSPKKTRLPDKDGAPPGGAGPAQEICTGRGEPGDLG